MSERYMASWCSYHPVVSPNAFGKAAVSMKNRAGNLKCVANLPDTVESKPAFGWWLAVTFLSCIKLWENERTAPRKCDNAVDLWYQTMGRHCLESGYIKILKTTWEGKIIIIIIISNDTCKIPQLYNAKNIFLYTHTYIYIYSIHNCSNL